ncbi:4-carboxymuconolactone decarboxylase [Acidiferrimicrobium sp. IK]|uniref:bifunctional 3-oxoadipate enol-lactonase/4-carboxymuconolactone decarboxylase PcaDC n=1 Tax=Acidiferrimicrobium sp. IK TaxID=2871700 RepID=UPI0021CB1791|nr:4-carboxymuconolactone decarboxylase [Acidiferrimicrobium sp. IK]MCU4186765.1 4-carboxymuconolactone decarboxylase [Acidiferrimicrobium sp. IK]
MTALPLTMVPLTAAVPGRPLLVVGPSLGTSCAALWGACAALLADDFEVVGWELPGHGQGPATTAAFRVEDLAEGVIAAVDARAGAQRVAADLTGPAFYYAGDSIGAAVGLALLLAHGERVAAATLACTGARIGTPEGWHDRAATVRAQGTWAVVEASSRRWFGPGFLERRPEAGARLLDALRHADAESYALACEALAAFDVRAGLGRIDTPLTVIAGTEDQATPVSGLEEIARGVPGARLRVLEGVGHLAPIEAPEAVAAAVRATRPEATAGDGRERTVAGVEAAGMAVRRAVAGDAWVDRAVAATTELTGDFQRFITQYAWGGVWTRPGLDRRSRSMITITALIARGHHEELAMHIRGGLTNGLTRDEIKEVLIQSAIYCGVPDANAAFRVAQRVFDEIDHGA